MRLHHVAMRTPSVERLLAFYVGVLGMRVHARSPAGVWVDLDGVLLMLETASPAEPPLAPGTMELVAFSIPVTERQSWMDRLRDAGVRIEAETDFTLYFRDPDGRRIGLSHYPDGPRTVTESP